MQRPDHSCATEIERRQRPLRRFAIPRMDWPNSVGDRRLSLSADCLNAVPHPSDVPHPLGQRLVLLGTPQHQPRTLPQPTMREKSRLGQFGMTP
jgi:hypothetical protein